MIYYRLRGDMVRTQIESRGIKNPGILRAMKKVERHLFVPENLREKAYGDFPLSIGDDQTISQPYIVALMTDLVKIEKNDKVLEIGTGSGYQTAILAELAGTVCTVERIAHFSQRAKTLLESLGYDNILYKTGDGYEGFPEEAPFRAIIVTCAPDFIPEGLIGQLEEGGRMIIPVGRPGDQVLNLVTVKGGETVTRDISYVRFVPMARGIAD